MCVCYLIKNASLLFILFCKGLAIFRKHFPKLCACLPQDYEETIRRVKKTLVVPDELMMNLKMLHNSVLANCTILAALIRPLTEETHLVGICETLKNVVDGLECKTFIENLRKGENYYLSYVQRNYGLLCIKYKFFI